MNIQEYNKVKDFTYNQYCDYLQKKYGKSKYDYFTKSWNKDNKVTRTKEGLIAHHKAENRFIMLSTVEFAKAAPFEYQKADNIIYCDYLEHLFLHILICKYPEPDNPLMAVGIGGAINFIIPELNDYYSGWKTSQTWRKTCLDKVKNDKDVYLTLVKRLKHECQDYPTYNEEQLYTSFNARFGLWDVSKNSALIESLKSL